MRRADKRIDSVAEVEDILRRAQVCRIGLSDAGQPYVVPVCFGYEGGRLYFHSAMDKGRKLDVLAENDRVCFEVDIDAELVAGGKGCDWTMKYRSVVGFGRATLLTDPAAKKKGLDAIMRHYGGEPQDYPDSMLARIVVARVDIESMTGRKSGYQSPPRSGPGFPG